MRRYFGIILAGLLVVTVLIALNAAGSVEFDRPVETEADPRRSTYNAGPTGLRALYQLLEQGQAPVERWRDRFDVLPRDPAKAVLVLVGPFQSDSWLSRKEATQLRDWVSQGGHALIISRFPRAQFPDDALHVKTASGMPSANIPADNVDQVLAPPTVALNAQPTELMRGVREVAISKFAPRLQFYLDPVSDEGAANKRPAPTPTPTPTPADSEEEPAPLYAPIVHLGDPMGALLAEFHYGQGRVVFLSDPFVVANNGIAKGGNLTLTLNLVRSLSGGEGGAARRIYFDEYHQGFRRESNPLFEYFRGTPMPWLLVQGGLLAALLLYTHGRRFARALPLPRTDRHSPLEFVGSMANLQQAAEARDLAIENIYPRFKAQLCRRLGLSSRAQISEILDAASQKRMPIKQDALRQVLTVSEAALHGEVLDDARLIRAVSLMRRLLAEMDRRRPGARQ